MKIIKSIAIGLLVAAPIVGLGAVVHADGVRSGTDVVVASGTVVNKTLFAFGPTVDIAGTVNGDIFCAGQTVDISGTVNGDVLCAGQTVNVSGMVNGNIRVAGQSVVLGGSASRNVSAAGQAVTMEHAMKVGGDASLAGQNVTVGGRIGRDLALGSNSATLSGAVVRDINAWDNSLTLTSTALVGGNIAYTSQNELEQMSGAHVAGTVIRTMPEIRRNTVHVGAVIGGSVGFAIYMFIALLCVALLLVILFPQLFQAASDVAIASPLKTLLAGFLAFVSAPVALIILAFTVFGIPFAMVGLLAWMLALSLAGPLSAYYAGRLLLRHQATNAVYVMVVGAGVLLVLYFVPVVGFVVTLLALWFGAGMIVLQVPKLPRPHYAIGNARKK